MVIRFLMTDPDDPKIESRNKYAVVIGLDPGSDDSFLLLTTSKLDKPDAIRQRVPDAFHELAVGSYGWVLKPTLLDLRRARPYSRGELRQKMMDGCLTFEEELRQEDMERIDTKLRSSQFIELRTLKKIVSDVK